MKLTLIFALLLCGCTSKPKAIERPVTKYEVIFGPYPRCLEGGWNWPRRADGHCYESDLGSPAMRKDMDKYIKRLRREQREP